MNDKFASTVTGMAFGLVLSRRQCNSLLRLYLHTNDQMERLCVIQVDGLNSLQRKGLVYWNQDKDGHANGFGGLTTAGALVAMLCIEAGITIEGTNTSIVLKRMGWEEERLARKQKEFADTLGGDTL